MEISTSLEILFRFPRKLAIQTGIMQKKKSSSRQPSQKLQQEISKTRREIASAKSKLAKLTRKLPMQEISPDLVVRDWQGNELTISELFGDKEDLIIVHNMGRACAYCTMWADGINGVVKHLENRSAFAVVSPDSPKVQKEFAASRGWEFRMLSGEGTTFIKEMGFEDPRGGFMPGVSTFHRDGSGKIFRVSKDQFGPGDDYCVVWHFFDLLKEGSRDWEPAFSY